MFKDLWKKIKLVLKSVREYKTLTLLTPLFMVGEAGAETTIPFFMSMMIKDIEHEIENLKQTHDTLTNKLLSLKPSEVDLSDPKSVVNNEIYIIYVTRIESDSKYKLRQLEIHFKDNTIETYIYKQKAQRIWILNNDKVILENDKTDIIYNFHWWQAKREDAK